MTKLIFLLITTLSVFTTIAQSQVRPVEALINNTEPGWPLVEEWIARAKNKVEVLPADPAKAKDALYNAQVTTRSPMGAIIYATGGLLVDNGWIRILGSGSSKLSRSLPGWNRGKSFRQLGDRPPFLLVADDAVGGFFAINGGQFGNDAGKVYYLSPDHLEWQPLGLNYTDFLNFCFNGDLTKFYQKLRWTSWKEDLRNLDGDSVFTFYPFLWSKEGGNINTVSRKMVPVEEQYIQSQSSRSQLSPDKKASY